MLDKVFSSGIAFAADSAKYLMKAGENVPVVELYVDFVFQPVRDSEGRVEWILVEGIDTTDRVAARLRGDALAALTEEVSAAKSVGDISFIVARMLG